MSTIVTRSKAKQAREQEALQQVKVDLNCIRKKAKNATYVIDDVIKELHKYPELSKFRIHGATTCTDPHYEFPPDVWESISGFNKEQTKKFMEKVKKMDEKEKRRDGGLCGYYGGDIEYTPKYLTTTYQGQLEFNWKANKRRGLEIEELIIEEEKFYQDLKKEEMVALSSGLLDI